MDEIRKPKLINNNSNITIKVGKTMEDLIINLRKKMATYNEKNLMRYDLTNPAVTDYIAKLFISKGLA